MQLPAFRRILQIELILKINPSLDEVREFKNQPKVVYNEICKNFKKFLVKIIVCYIMCVYLFVGLFIVL